MKTFLSWKKKPLKDYSHTLLTLLFPGCLLQSLPLPSSSPLPPPQSIWPWRPSGYSPDPRDLCLLLYGTRIRDKNSGNFFFRVIAYVYMKKKYTDTVSFSRNFMKIWIIHHSLCSNTVKKKTTAAVTSVNSSYWELQMGFLLDSVKPN